MKHAKEKEGNKILVGPELILLCKHCEKPIDRVKLIGFSLICPLCGKPQNGQSHPETKEIILETKEII